MLAYFSLTLFISATLLFLVQPMIGKMILPNLGGTPAVWNTCMVFFQAVLLVGYGYTHLLTTTQTTRRQVIIQGCLLFSPFLLFVLPFSLGDWSPETEGNPVFSLLVKLTLMVGLPFFLVSTTAPLLQKWFFHTGHPAAKDPYFLYGASNLGSMLGLLMYPTIVEPWLPVSPTAEEPTWETQVHLWTLSYAVFVGLVVGCAVIVWQAVAGKFAAPVEAPAESIPVPASAPAPAAVVETAIAPAPSVSKRRGRRKGIAVAAGPASTNAELVEQIKKETPAENLAQIEKLARELQQDDITIWRRLRWIGLAAAPSSLMLGVTTYMTTDIAAIAFFWIIPLALYLLTFILVFARWPMVWTETPHMVVMFVQPCLILFLVLKMVANLAPPTWAEFLLHLGAFFGTALMCHGELAKDRPSTKYLTEFYFWMSLGGVLGGLFNALLAPIVFQLGLWEYMIAMVFACLLRSNLVEEVKTLIPGDSTVDKATPFGYGLDFGVPIVLGVAGYYATYYGDAAGPFTIGRIFLLAGISVVAFILVAGYYFTAGGSWSNPDSSSDVAREPLVQFYRRPENLRMLLGLAALCVAAAGVVFFRDVSFDVTNVLKKSYMLAVLVVIVLALSLRPIRFGLSIGALFIAMTIYQRQTETYVYEGRSFFGQVRVKEVEGEWSQMPKRLAHSYTPHEWKIYRRLMHGTINHGQQIVGYKDDRAIHPVLAVSTFGLAGTPVGDGRLLAALAIFPEGDVMTPDGPVSQPRTELTLTSREQLMRKRREPITYFHERNGVAEVFYKLCFPNAQPVCEVANMNGAADVRLPTAMVGLAAGEFAVYSMLANTQSEPPFAVVGLGTGLLACYAKPYQHVDFYEIDPLVKNLSIVPGYVPPWHPERSKMPKLPDPMFYFVHDAQERWAKIDVQLGDGRLKMKEDARVNEKGVKVKEPREGYYHVIVLDAFSSDAIPVHLLTKDAVKLYLDKLAEGGVLVFNTTNKFVHIEGVLATIADELNLECLFCSDIAKGWDHPDRYQADWLVMQRKIDKATYRNGGLPIRQRLEEKRDWLWWDGTPVTLENKRVPEQRWRKITPFPGPAWTDGYSNMLNPRVMPWLLGGD